MIRTIKVTQADIDRAQRNNSYKCVVAQAIARQIPNAHHIEVDTQTIRFTIDDERHVFLTPPVPVGYVIAFDAGDEIWPFKFQLRDRVPVPTRRARVVRTPEGKAADAASRRARVAARQAAASAKTTTRSKRPKKSSKPIDDSKKSSIKPIDDLGDARAAAQAAYTATRVSQPGPASKTDDGGRKPPPRVFKRGQRSYGMRQLRINRES